jgi:hypothetical protein
LDKVISEIPKPLKMVLCSSHEIVSLKKNFKLVGLPVFYWSLVSPPSSNGWTIPLKVMFSEIDWKKDK